MPASLPYAIPTPTFRFRHLANLAGRAPIGGAREVALACFVTARLAVECALPATEDPEARTARAAAAKTWLGTLALPVAVRTPLLKCAELSGSAGSGPVGREVAALAAAASSFLDAASRAELDALASSLKGSA